MNTILPWDGKPISEPGIYSDIPLAKYHEQLTDAPSISSSGLRTIENQSPLHWWHGSYLNPEAPAREQKAHFSLGSAVHELCLGETGFKTRYAIRPSEFSDWRTKAAKEWRDAAIAAGLTVLTEDDLTTIRGVAASLQADPLVQQGLFHGVVEHSLVWKDPETGVWLKSRPDVLDLESLFIVDLKTTASASGQDVRRSIGEFGYHQQLALVAEGIEVLTGRRVGNDRFVLVFVETKPPYAVNCKLIDAGAIELGKMQNRRAIRRFAECLSANAWPGYDDNGSSCHLPAWLEKRLEEEAKSGLLPEPLKTNATETV